MLEPKPGDRNAAGGSFIANGVRAQLNNFLLDGVDNNSKIVDQQNSSPVVVQPSVDAVLEFKVETNNYSAEYGYSAGAVVNATIKGGTNQLHGGIFEFVRNDLLDARNYFATSPDPLKQNQFGVTIGGPILKSKLFCDGRLPFWARRAELGLDPQRHGSHHNAKHEKEKHKYRSLHGVNLLSEMDIRPGHARTVLYGIATRSPRDAPCYTQMREQVGIFVKHLHDVQEFFRHR